MIHTDIEIFIFDHLFFKEIFGFKYFNEISYSYPNIATQKRVYVFILIYENNSQNSVCWSLSSVGISFRNSNNTTDNINDAQTYNSLNLETYSETSSSTRFYFLPKTKIAEELTLPDILICFQTVFSFTDFFVYSFSFYCTGTQYHIRQLIILSVKN